MANASCRGNHQVLSPTSLSPELDCKSFTTGLLGSDGESDPFDTSSPPESESGYIPVQDRVSGCPEELGQS